MLLAHWAIPVPGYARFTSIAETSQSISSSWDSYRSLGAYLHLLVNGVDKTNYSWTTLPGKVVVWQNGYLKKTNMLQNTFTGSEIPSQPTETMQVTPPTASAQASRYVVARWQRLLALCSQVPSMALSG